MKTRIINIIYNAVYQVFTVIIPVITMPYVSRVLGAENIGINTYTQSLVLLFGIFINSSILQVGAREIAGEDKKSRTKVFIMLWFLQVLSGIVIISIYFFSIIGSKYEYYYLLQLPFLISYVFDISWFFIGLEKIKNVVFRNMLVKISTLVCIFIFVQNKSDLSTYIFINSIGSLLGNLIFFIPLKDYLSFGKEVNFSKEYLNTFIKSIIILLVPQLSIQLYQYVIKFTIERYSSTIDLAYFDQSQKIARIVIQLISSASIVLMPIIASLDKKKSTKSLNKIVKLSANYSLSLAVFFTIILVSITPEFVPIFFGPDFYNMVPNMVVSSFIVIPICFGGVFSNQLVLGKGLYGLYSIPYLLGGFIGVLLCFIFRKNMNGLVGSIILIIIEVLICITRVILSKRIISLRTVLSGVSKELILLIVLVAEIAVFNSIYSNSGSLFANIICTLVLALEYIILSWIIKTNTSKDLGSRIRKSILNS